MTVPGKTSKVVMKMNIRANSDPECFARNIVEYQRISGSSLDYWSIVGKINHQLAEVENKLIDSVDNSSEITE
jgi:hypothetical protein